MEEQMNNAPVADNTPKGSKSWLTILVVLVVVVIIAGYFMYFKQGELPTIDEANEASLETQLKTQSTSDETSSIEADLEATDLDSLDTGIENL